MYTEHLCNCQPYPVVVRPGVSGKLLSNLLVSKHSDTERKTLTVNRCPFP